MSTNALPATRTALEPTSNHAGSLLIPLDSVSNLSSESRPLESVVSASMSATDMSYSISSSTLSQPHTSLDNDSSTSTSSLGHSADDRVGPRDPQVPLSPKQQPSLPREGTPLPQGLEPAPNSQSLDHHESRAPLPSTPKDKSQSPQPQDSPSSATGVTHGNTANSTANSVAQDRHRYSPDRSSLVEQEMDLPKISLEHPPPYSYSAGSRGSTLMVAGPASSTEEHLFQIQELTPSVSGSGSSPVQHQFICANPMHDQQYLLVGSGNALHSVDLTLPADKQAIRTHIQGIAFKEIHCLEDIGLVVVIAGRSARVRCYDYDAIKRLISYGHSKEGQGRVVEGGKLGAVKNMIQLRVETAFLKDESQGPSGSPKSSPGGHSTTNQTLKGSSPSPSTTPQPQPQHHHRHSGSIDRSLLSPPIQSDNPGFSADLKSIGEDDPDVSTTTSPTVTGAAITSSSPPAASSTVKKHKQRPMSFGGLASLAHEHIMKGRSQPQQPQPTPSNPGETPLSSSSTPTSPITGNAGSKTKRLSQMASYLSQAAVNSSVAAQMAIVQDVPSEEAISWAWDFTKLKQTKDVLALDFHYTTSTVYMTVLSKNGIDIYCRPKVARGRKAPPCPTSPSGNAAATGSGTTRSPGGANGRNSGSETPGRSSTSTLGGTVAAAGGNDNGTDIYEWRQVKQFYHPEAPSFMTVVKNRQEVTDIILGKGPRACVINVESMSVTDMKRQENGGGVIQGISKKLGFKNFPLWHSFDKIPFDIPPHILYPEAGAAVYDRGDSKEQYATYGSEQRDRRQDRPSVYVDSYSMLSDAGRRSHDDILQRPRDQQNIHQEQLEEQERVEAETLVLKLQQTQLQDLQAPKTHGPSSNVSSSSSSSSNLAQPPTTMQGSSGGSGKASKRTRMVTSDKVLNKAFSQRTAFQLFLATCGSQSRIVDLQGRPQSPIVLEWGSCPPQKIEFLQTTQDIYVVGFEKTCIVIFSLLRARKIKEYSKKDLIHGADAASVAPVLAPTIAVSLPGSAAAATSPPTASIPTTDANQHLTSDYTSSSSSTASVMTGTSYGIKFLGRDDIADDSLCIFFSYQHPRNGVSICKLGIVTPQADLELMGYYP